MTSFVRSSGSADPVADAAVDKAAVDKAVDSAAQPPLRGAELPAGATAVDLPGGGRMVLPEEVPVALVYDGVTQAVMMATPADMADFHTGFALTEGLVSGPEQISGFEEVAQPRGIEARGWLAAPAGARFRERRRALAGPVGCGLCGIDSLEQALRPLPSLAERAENDNRQPVPGGAGPGGTSPAAWLDAARAEAALDALRAEQVLKNVSRATHAAGFCTEAGGLVMLREDVGRHNALDKLAGGLLRTAALSTAARNAGAVVMTSRVSVDLVQKAVMLGAGALVAPSAPTALAVAEAQAAGLRLIARGPEGRLALYVQGAGSA